MQTKINGIQIFKKGNLTVTRLDCGNYIISNGNVNVVKEQMPQLEIKPLLSLLIDKDVLTDCYVIGKANNIIASDNGAAVDTVFNNWFARQNELSQAYMMGY